MKINNIFLRREPTVQFNSTKLSIVIVVWISTELQASTISIYNYDYIASDFFYNDNNNNAELCATSKYEVVGYLIYK